MKKVGESSEKVGKGWGKPVKEDKLMKKILAALLAGIFLILSFTGCSGKTKPDTDNPVTLTMWHVYGSQTSSPLNDVIDEFNNTTGKDNGVLIKVTMITDSGKIDEALTATLTGDPGTQELPDLFVAYPRIAEAFEDDTLLDFTQYFSEEELSLYRKDFLSEGYFGEKLLMLPIAKSSELIFVNKTLFDRFSAETGVTTDCFKTVESLMTACNTYYDWSDGKTMFQINDFYHYFLANMTAINEEFITDGKINADSDAFEKVFAPIAEAGIYGGLCVGDGYASDRWKTAEVIGSAGSTAGILYLRDHVTYEDNSTEDIETLVLPYACLKDSTPTVVQRGGGLFAVKNEDERKNEAAAIFAKWIAEKQHNLDFVTNAGYLPVTDEAFEQLFLDIPSVENEKYRMLYSAVSDQYSNNYQFCSVPLFEGASDTQKDFEKLMKATLSDYHEQYVSRVQNGEDKDTVMQELTASALTQIRTALK